MDSGPRRRRVAAVSPSHVGAINFAEERLAAWRELETDPSLQNYFQNGPFSDFLRLAPDEVAMVAAENERKQMFLQAEIHKLGLNQTPPPPPPYTPVEQKEKRKQTTDCISMEEDY